MRDGAGERGRGQGVNERAAHSGTVSGQWEILTRFLFSVINRCKKSFSDLCNLDSTPR